MLRSKSRDRELSKNLRKLVCESIGSQIQRAPWDRTNTGTDQREICNKSEDVGKRLSEFQGEDQHCWQKHCAMLGSDKSEVLAAILLERLQSFATTALQEPVHNEQRDRVCC